MQLGSSVSYKTKQQTGVRRYTFDIYSYVLPKEIVLYRQEFAESTKLQIYKVRQLINEIYVDFIHRGFKIKRMLIRNNYVLP